MSKKESKIPLPVHESIHVIDYMNVYKTARWWKAVSIQISRGRLEVCVYMWNWRVDVDPEKSRWVRKQKLVERDYGQWTSTRDSVEKFISNVKDGFYDKILEDISKKDS